MTSTKDATASFANGSCDAARAFSVKRGRNILKQLVKDEASRAVLENTLQEFKQKLLSSSSDKAVSLDFLLSMWPFPEYVLADGLFSCALGLTGVFAASDTGLD